METSRMRKSCSGRRLAASSFLLLLIQLAIAASFTSTCAFALPNNVTSKRVVYYYQTQFANGDTGSFNSLLPLISKKNLDSNGKPFTTDVFVGAFHLGPEADRTQIHLNDFPPNSSRFDTLWNETLQIQSKGINVNLFLGGYLDQSYVNLANNFSYYYPVLKQTLLKYKFNGIDLDVEDGLETTEGIESIIHHLRKDFGPKFIITLAPVVSDMNSGGFSALSLINYTQLYSDVGANISWFNVQFYSGFGTLATPTDYISIVNSSFPANVVVGAMIANETDGGGFVDLTTVKKTVVSLVKLFPDFGGVAAWEYYNALPGGEANPAEWATYFGKAMGIK